VAERLYKIYNKGNKDNFSDDELRTMIKDVY